MARLLVDAMCGTLATYLRMCGHDAAYALDRGVEADDALREMARLEGRRLVTRDRELAAAADGALPVTGRDVEAQLRDLEAAGLDLSLSEPARCGACNGTLDRLPADATTPDDAPDPGAEAVWRCTDCGQRFWRGSHWADVAETLEAL